MESHTHTHTRKYIRKSEEVSMFSKFSPLSQRNYLQTRFSQYCELTGSYSDCLEFTMFTKDPSTCICLQSTRTKSVSQHNRLHLTGFLLTANTFENDPKENP